MKELPLPVVLSAVISNGRILLLRRKKGDYCGLLGLPGGKVEPDEHISQAAIREVLEESGIKSDFVRHLGVVSEILHEEGGSSKNFLLHICELKPKSTEILGDSEGKLGWFDLKELAEIKHELIPSDFLMVGRMLINHEKGYFDCVLEKKREGYVLKKFE